MSVDRAVPISKRRRRLVVSSSEEDEECAVKVAVASEASVADQNNGAEDDIEALAKLYDEEANGWAGIATVPAPQPAGSADAASLVLQSQGPAMQADVKKTVRNSRIQRPPARGEARSAGLSLHRSIPPFKAANAGDAAYAAGQSASKRSNAIGEERVCDDGGLEVDKEECTKLQSKGTLKEHAKLRCAARQWLRARRCDRVMSDRLRALAALSDEDAQRFFGDNKDRQPGTWNFDVLDERIWAVEF